MPFRSGFPSAVRTGVCAGNRPGAAGAGAGAGPGTRIPSQMATKATAATVTTTNALDRVRIYELPRVRLQRHRLVDRSAVRSEWHGKSGAESMLAQKVC